MYSPDEEDIQMRFWAKVGLADDALTKESVAMSCEGHSRMALRDGNLASIMRAPAFAQIMQAPVHWYKR